MDTGDHYAIRNVIKHIPAWGPNPWGEIDSVKQEQPPSA
jgi:hypothetical protein